MASFEITFTEEEPFAVAFESSEGFSFSFNNTVRIGDFDPYEGEYDFYPSDEDQVINTESLLMRQDIIIHAIPNTYGHISWDGAVLSVY